MEEPGFLKLAARCPAYLEKQLSSLSLNALTVEFIQRLLKSGDNKIVSLAYWAPVCHSKNDGSQGSNMNVFGEKHL